MFFLVFKSLIIFKVYIVNVFTCSVWSWIIIIKESLDIKFWSLLTPSISRGAGVWHIRTSFLREAMQTDGTRKMGLLYSGFKGWNMIAYKPFRLIWWVGKTVLRNAKYTIFSSVWITFLFFLTNCCCKLFWCFDHSTELQAASSLNSSHCYILQAGGSFFTWLGSLSSPSDHNLLDRMMDKLCVRITLQANPLFFFAMFLDKWEVLPCEFSCIFWQPLKQSLLVREGSEPDRFWEALGGRSEYSKEKQVKDWPADPHLYTCHFEQGIEMLFCRAWKSLHAHKLF